MAATNWSQTTVSKVLHFDSVSLNFVPKGPLDNKPALVQMTHWHWTMDKPLSEPVMVYFTDEHGIHELRFYVAVSSITFLLCKQETHRKLYWWYRFHFRFRYELSEDGYTILNKTTLELSTMRPIELWFCVEGQKRYKHIWRILCIAGLTQASHRLGKACDLLRNVSSRVRFMFHFKWLILTVYFKDILSTILSAFRKRYGCIDKVVRK